MHQPGEVLAVEVLELAMEVAQAKLFAHCIIGTGEAEVTRLAAPMAIRKEAGTVG
ncbi:hypothetical protein D3C77_750790 [compost metagenome]